MRVRGKMASVLYNQQIHCTASAGASLHAAILEGTLMALQESRVVRFEFNGTEIYIDPLKITGTLMNEWQQRRDTLAALARARTAVDNA